MYMCTYIQKEYLLKSHSSYNDYGNDDVIVMIMMRLVKILM